MVQVSGLVDLGEIPSLRKYGRNFKLSFEKQKKVVIGSSLLSLYKLFSSQGSDPVEMHPAAFSFSRFKLIRNFIIFFSPCLPA